MSKKNQISERSDDTRQSVEKKRKIGASHIAIIVLAVVLVGVLVYFLWPSVEEVSVGNGRETAQGGKGTVLTLDNLEEERERLSNPGPDGQYTISMTTNWLFETAQTPSKTVVVNNVESNSRTVYFDVALNDSGTLIYSSPYIPLGETLKEFALDEDLKAGVYDATVTFFLVDDNNEIVTDVSTGVTITIEK